MKTILHPTARFLVSLIFILSGLGKIFAFGATAAKMDAAGFPAPFVLLVGAILIETLAGAALLLGFKTRYAAWGLVAFLIPATIVFHAANIADPVHGQEQIVQTLKNLAILGALLKFAADGAGLFSLDNFLAKKNSSQGNKPKVEIENAVSV
jgi:putative oxidoreductase